MVFSDKTKQITSKNKFIFLPKDLQQKYYIFIENENLSNTRLKKCVYFKIALNLTFKN